MRANGGARRKHLKVRRAEGVGWLCISRFGPRGAVESRPRDGDSPLGSILSGGRFVSHLRTNHVCRAVSFRAWRMVINLARLFFSLAPDPNRLTAFSGAALLTFSVQFLLYARQSRYCAMNMLLVVWLFWAFFKMKSARQCVSFVIAAALLFHSHPYGLAPVVALGGLSFIYRPFRNQRRWILFAAPAVAVLTLPWLALSSLSSSGSELNIKMPASFSEVLERLVQAAIETTSVTSLIGAAILLISGALCVRFGKQSPVTSETVSGVTQIRVALDFWRRMRCRCLLGVLATAVVYGFETATTQSSDFLWLAGMRYASAVIPLQRWQRPSQSSELPVETDGSGLA